MKYLLKTAGLPDKAMFEILHEVEAGIKNKDKINRAMQLTNLTTTYSV